MIYLPEIWLDIPESMTQRPRKRRLEDTNHAITGLNEKNYSRVYPVLVFYYEGTKI